LKRTSWSWKAGVEAAAPARELVFMQLFLFDRILAETGKMHKSRGFSRVDCSNRILMVVSLGIDYIRGVATRGCSNFS
jgi:hypothetical protein